MHLPLSFFPIISYSYGFFISSLILVDLRKPQPQPQPQPQPPPSSPLLTSQNKEEYIFVVQALPLLFYIAYLLMEGFANERLHFGKMGFGCQHYRRRCMIRAPCCNEIFTCRHCHNEAASLLRIRDRHELDRYDVNQVVCAVCDTEQPVGRVCTNCGVSMGEYFCEICKFYDDDVDKKQFHCDDCGICRVGGRENFFHCKKCGSCYSVALRGNHMCIENSMHHHCPICYEYLFDSLKDTTVLKCGHTMHWECFHEMMKRDKYCCPICSKSVIDMSRTWKRLDEEIEATTMPEDFRHKKVWILCNDCNDTTEVYFHIIGQKCSHCKSYNTRQIAAPVLPE